MFMSLESLRSLNWHSHLMRIVALLISGFYMCLGELAKVTTEKSSESLSYQSNKAEKNPMKHDEREQAKTNGNSAIKTQVILQSLRAGQNLGEVLLDCILERRLVASLWRPGSLPATHSLFSSQTLCFDHPGARWSRRPADQFSNSTSDVVPFSVCSHILFQRSLSTISSDILLCLLC